jgi:Tfp pilus assembly protein PilV
MRDMNARVRQLARRQDGFGMPELLLAMVVLIIGVFAVFGLFASGVVTLERASRIATASAIADSQIEQFRTVRYEVIGLTAAALGSADSTYTGDPAYRAPGTNLVNEAVTTGTSSYVPTESVTGADGKPYRVDVYITWQSTSSGGGSTTGRNVKLVTVVVRDGTTLTKVWNRATSSFDQTTGS